MLRITGNSEETLFSVGGERMKETRKKVIIVPYPMNNTSPIIGDPGGSYTGIPLFPFEDPVQDADDL